VKTLVAALVLLVALAGCCSHPVEVAALERSEVEIDKMSTLYLKYVDADPEFGGALTPEQRKEARKNERAWTVRVKGVVTSVKKSLED